MIAFDVIDIGDPQNRAEPVRFHLHRPGFRRSSRRRLGERRRHGRVKSDVALNFFHRLVNVAVQDRDGSKTP